jgi:hypothetical protein
MKYTGWVLCALVLIPATAINGLLWRRSRCEWHRPYGSETP